MANKKKNKLEPRPEVGKFYHFWDDGKTSASRHYICKCEEIITPIQAMSRIITERGGQKCNVTLYDVWLQEVDEHRQGDNFKVLNGASTKTGEPWLYAEDTDVFVRLSCPKYDKNDLWAVRTIWGGWFTMDTTNWWQSGTLDVTSKIYDEIIEYYTNEGYDTSGYTKQTY